jgi:eukaryotic-like serine/threonine-protein kinase
VPDSSQPSPPAGSLGPGAVIVGRYQLESLLGRGGMGSVWRAEHLNLKSSIAIKLLDPAIAGNEQMVGRFLREAQSAASLRSPNVVQIFDYGVDEGTGFIAMELLQGESLGERIKRLERVPHGDLFRFLGEVLRAIGKAHEAGIVHRDLKPDNIFICKDDPEYAKVLDFGVAKIQKGALAMSIGGGTQTGMMIGTPYYMSPEQTQAKEVDHRSDLWAIAVIAFEALTGRRPFQGESFGELVIEICTTPIPVPSNFGAVPPGFDEWFVHATQRDRLRRFQSAREMAEELARLSVGTPGRPITFSTGPLRSVTPMLVPQHIPMPRDSLGPKPDANLEQSDADRLQLTTGQRSVLSRSGAAASSGTSPALVALLGVAALIVVGVIAFVARGGARAFREPDAAQRAPLEAVTAAAGPTAAEAAARGAAPPASAAAGAAAFRPDASASGAAERPPSRPGK